MYGIPPGKYIGFDLNEPTSKQLGKAEVMFMLKKKFGYKKLIMIGDGSIDAEAHPPADAFIGIYFFVLWRHIQMVRITTYPTGSGQRLREAWNPTADVLSLPLRQQPQHLSHAPYESVFKTSMVITNLQDYRLTGSYI